MSLMPRCFDVTTEMLCESKSDGVTTACAQHKVQAGKLLDRVTSEVTP